MPARSGGTIGSARSGGLRSFRAQDRAAQGVDPTDQEADRDRDETAADRHRAGGRVENAKLGGQQIEARNQPRAAGARKNQAQ